MNIPQMLHHRDIHCPLLQMKDKHQEHQAASCTHTAPAPAPEQKVTKLVFVNTNVSHEIQGLHRDSTATKRNHAATVKIVQTRATPCGWFPI